MTIKCPCCGSILPAPEYGVSVGYDVHGNMTSIRHFGDAPEGAVDWEATIRVSQEQTRAQQEDDDER